MFFEFSLSNLLFVHDLLPFAKFGCLKSSSYGNQFPENKQLISTSHATLFESITNNCLFAINLYLSAGEFCLYLKTDVNY